MPLSLIFHIRYAFALHGMGQDDRRLAFISFCRTVGLIQGIRIVTVDVEDMPAKAFPLGVHGFHIFNRYQGIDELQAITIDNQTNIVQMVL